MGLVHLECIKSRLEQTNYAFCFRKLCLKSIKGEKWNTTPDAFYGRSCLGVGIEGIELRIEDDGVIAFSSVIAYFLRN